MTGFIEVLRSHGADYAHRMAIDPVVDFPIDYRLLLDLVAVLACDLVDLHDADRPVAVQMDCGLGLALLDLALIAAGIPQLPLPKGFSPAQKAHAMARAGARAGYLGGTGMIRLRNAIPMSPLPDGTARIAFIRSRSGHLVERQVPQKTLLEIARAQVEAGGRKQFDRHLALQPSSQLSEAVAGLYPTILAGGTYVTPPGDCIGFGDSHRPDFRILAEAIAELRITSVVFSPKLLAGLVPILEARHCRLPTLARIIVDNGPIPDALAERCGRLDLPVRTVDDLMRSTGRSVFAGRPEIAPGRVGSR